MYYYSVSAGTPEGTDFTLMVSHPEQYTNDTFCPICEDALIYALEESHKRGDHAWLSSIDRKDLVVYLERFGFSAIEESASYYLEPYFNIDKIKSEKLRQWIDRDGIDNAPAYFNETR